MNPSLTPGRARRASAIRLHFLGSHALVLALGCSTTHAPQHVGVGAVETPPASTVERGNTAKEGGTGTRAKPEQGRLGSTAQSPPLAEAVVAPSVPGMKPSAGLGLSGRGAGDPAWPHGVLRSVSPKQQGVLLPRPAEPQFNTEAYASLTENPFVSVREQPLSTFSSDVDTASYSNARRFINEGRVPPPDAIRVEEWLNYFSYAYAPPTGDAPVAIHTEVSTCPWAPTHRLVRIGIKARPVEQAQVPPRNLVFLIDVSGSMMPANKLPLLKSGLLMLTRTLRAEDHVALVVYAGSSGLALPSTSGADQARIMAALGALEAGGSTNGGEGIELAYRVAQEHFRKDGINRVVLATDGDFNVGTTDEGALTRLIEAKRETGVFLTVLGFGEGNVKDSTMERLADKGNGNYAYIDSVAEARKVLVHEAGSTLVTVAKDVKLQAEFNPARVQSYRLIGYEDRALATQDFNDDKKDAGDMGAGHAVTALYEVVPVGVTPPANQAPAVSPLKYQTTTTLAPPAAQAELLTVSVRYKSPLGNMSQKISEVVVDQPVPFASASTDQRFAAAVAEFAQVLRGSKSVGTLTLADARKAAWLALTADATADRLELVSLIERADGLRTTPGRAHSSWK